MIAKTALVLAAANAVSAHFGLVYPEWRADTLANEDTSPYSQWVYPCANVSYRKGNITDWPLDGGSIKLDLHHPWTYLFVNLGIGNDTTNFNITLTPDLHNVTGKGELCLEKLALPESIQDGTLGSLQVVTLGESGNALYNCADIRFSKAAKTQSNCTSADGIKVLSIKDQTVGNAAAPNNGTASNDTAGAAKDDKSAAGAVRLNGFALAAAVGAASVFAFASGI